MNIKLADQLSTEDKTECGMPLVFMFATNLACAPPKNIQRLKYLQIVNGSRGFMRSIKVDPDEPRMPRQGEPRYDPGVWWLEKPPLYVVVEFLDSKLDPTKPLEGLPTTLRRHQFRLET